MKPFCCLKGVKNIIKQKGLDLLFEIIESIHCVCLSVHAQITEPSFIHFGSENHGKLGWGVWEGHWLLFAAKNNN